MKSRLLWLFWRTLLSLSSIWCGLALPGRNPELLAKGYQTRSAVPGDSAKPMPPAGGFDIDMIDMRDLKGAHSAVSSGLSNINIRSRQILRGRQEKDSRRSRDGLGMEQHQEHLPTKRQRSRRLQARAIDEKKMVVGKEDKEVKEDKEGGKAVGVSQYHFKKTVGFADSVDEGDDYPAAVSFNKKKMMTKVGFADSVDEGDDYPAAVSFNKKKMMSVDEGDDEFLASVILDLFEGDTVALDLDKIDGALMELGECGDQHDQDHELGLGAVSRSAPTSPDWPEHLQLDTRIKARPMHISKWPSPELVFGDNA